MENKLNINEKFDPTLIESKWIQYWEENKSFEPNFDFKTPFSIVIPPPNVTGNLHIGHALNHVIQDIIIRIERKKKKCAVWIPGTDHAGIATQVVVERELAKENIKRENLGRVEFEKKVWAWKHKSKDNISNQQKLLGDSVDWSRERFTLDEGLSKAVLKVFVDLFNEGLIYRGERIINWCPVTQTAISDLEVEYKEVNGKLYFIRYQLENSSESVVVATTRPETMFGDVAVCANPEDPRYSKLKNSFLIHPLTKKKIPLLFDSFVDQEFGTGLVKITPAHDSNDYEAAIRLKLPFITIFNKDATLNEYGEECKGLDRFSARKKVIEKLTIENQIEKIIDHKHQVGHNQRGGAMIEPMLSNQWFLKMESLANPAIDAVKSQKIEFFPKVWEKTYFEWMYNIKDWCISRQLWWGHRIPAYYCDLCNHMMVSLNPISTCSKCNSTKIHRDEDVLDTWFSSALWPFSVFGWPEKNKELDLFFPTSVLVTAFDIIFFWVARMIMMSLKFMNNVPFKKVVFHGLIRDEDRKKFSKSIGNVIDPLEMMKKYGTDSFRFFLAATLPEGKDIIFNESRLDGYKAFCNKIWNLNRFVLLNRSQNFKPIPLNEIVLNDFDSWIIDRFNSVISQFEFAYSKFHFFEMAKVIYDFIWKDLCDWYVEFSKSLSNTNETQKDQILIFILKNSMSVLHPFMPFITEEINSFHSDISLTRTPFPEKIEILLDQNSINSIKIIQEIVTVLRAYRSESNIPNSKKIDFKIISKNPEVEKIIKSHENSMKALTKSEKIEFIDFEETIHEVILYPFSLGKISIKKSDNLDLGKEKIRLEKELEKLDIEMEKTSKKITNPDFLNKAKPEVIEKERSKLASFKEKIQILKDSINKL